MVRSGRFWMLSLPTAALCNPGALPCHAAWVALQQVHLTHSQLHTSNYPAMQQVLLSAAQHIMAQPKAYLIGGIGATPTLEDVSKIAEDSMQVALDPAGAERVKKLSPAPKSFQAADAPAIGADNSDQQPLATHLARAVLATKLLQLMNGRSGVRVLIPEFLTQLLNSPQLPLVLRAGAHDADVLKQIAAACYGQGVQAEGYEPPKLSSAEQLILQGGAAVTAGIAAVVVQASKKLLSLAAAGAALSLEALGAQVKNLDADLMEAQGHKAAMAVADEMRGLLEGSKRVGIMKAAESDSLPPAFSAAAQRLGSLGDSTSTAYSAARSELLTEALPPKGGQPGNVVSPSLAPSILDLARALLCQATDASARAVKVLQSDASGQAFLMLGPAMHAVQDSSSSAKQQVIAVGQQVLLCGTEETPGVSAALAAAAALEAATLAVALEALASVVVLRMLEGPPAAPAAPEDGAGVAEGGEAAAAAADGGKKKEKEGKKKDRKGGAGAGVQLGKGTGVLREYVEAAAASAPGSATRVLPTSSITSNGAEGSPAPQQHGHVVERAALQGALDRVAAALAPRSSAASKLLEELRAVVEVNQARRKPKVPKGARDFLPEQMAIRETAFGIITSVFKRHGAVSIDTPVFELRETLMGKYGEDSKLIYDLADQGGEVLSLRYDLTVPFARYVAVNGIGNIKRYHIGKVYRRDQPQMNRGRFREFFQCDFDIAGAYPTMTADSEVMKVLVEILSDLDLGEFEIKLNHRKLLDAMMQIAGVPSQKFRAICSAIDKLDKEPWEAVRSEMVDDKGLPPAVADKIGEFVVLRGEPMALLQQLMSADHALSQHPDSREALEELKLLFGFLQSMKALGPVVFDLSLARGLDYYTGVIYEAVLKGANVGSIAAGGRYDKLVGMFSGKDVPAVGVSIGIERVFAIMETRVREKAAAEGRRVRAIETEVLVASIGNNLQPRRMEIASDLWSAGVKAEFGYKSNPKMGDQLNYALEEGIPFMVLFGDDEIKSGVVKVKDMAAKTEDVVTVSELVATLSSRVAAWREQQKQQLSQRQQ